MNSSGPDQCTSGNNAGVKKRNKAKDKYNKDYYNKNKEKFAEYQKQYRNKNKEKFAERRKRRHKEEKQAKLSVESTNYNNDQSLDAQDTSNLQLSSAMQNARPEPVMSTSSHIAFLQNVNTAQNHAQPDISTSNHAAFLQNINHIKRLLELNNSYSHLSNIIARAFLQNVNAAQNQDQIATLIR